METKIISKYLKIYWQLFKFAAIADTTYRTSFFMMLFVEAAYIFVVFLSMKIIYANVGMIAGWNYYQMMVLLGVYSIFSESILGIAFIHNLRSLPSKIVNGELDLILTKPINSLFAVSLWRPYFALIPSFIPGLLAIYYGFHNGGLVINCWLIIPFVFLFFCGQVIAYSLGCIISSLSFWWIGAEPLPNLAEEVLFMAGKPSSIYFGLWKVIFLAVIPLMFMVSIPVQTLLGEIKWWWFLLSPLLAVIFLKLAISFWKTGLSRYQSASS